MSYLDIPKPLSDAQTLRAEVDRLRVELEKYKQHQAYCQCGGATINHTVSDEHYPVPFDPEPCPYLQRAKSAEALATSAIEELAEADQKIIKLRAVAEEALQSINSGRSDKSIAAILRKALEGGE